MLVCTMGFHTGVSAFTPGRAGGHPPGVPDLTHPDTRLIITNNYSVADGLAQNTVVAHIVDEFGVPVPNVTISFKMSSGGGNPVTTTDVNGNAYFTFTGDAVGPVSITAKVGTASITNGSPAITYFVAGPPDPTAPTTTLTVITDNSKANNIAANRVRAHITDAYGNPISGQTILFTITSGTASITSLNPITTGPSGNADLTLVSVVAGQVHITATMNGIPITNGSPAIVTFVADVPQTTHPYTNLSVVANNAIANGAATNSVKAHISDAQGNPVPNATVVFTIASGTASFASPATVTTGPNGEAVVTLTSTVVGTVTITATVNGLPIINGSPASVKFVADVPSVGNPLTTLIILTNNSPANGSTPNHVRAVIRDANNNPVQGATVVFSILSGTGTIVGSGTTTTDASGHAIVSITSTVAGNVSIVATVNGTPIVNGSPAVVKFVADVPQPSNPATALNVVTNNALANGTATNSVKARVVDANGNPVPNATIVFTIASGTATFASPATVTTGPNGEAVVTLKSTVVGTVTITATVNGLPIINGSPASVKFVADVPSVGNPLTTLIILTNNSPANGSTPNHVRAVIRDANNNPVQGATVVFSILSGTGTIVGSGTTTTDASGHAIVSITSTVAGNVSIVATVNGTPIVNGSPAVVKFVADVPQPSNPATALSVVTNNALANGTATNSVKARVVDANGNPVPNATIVFTIASGTATFASPATVITGPNGEAVVTLTSTVTGSVNITATVNGLPIVNGSPATVIFTADAPEPTNPGTALSVEVTGMIADGASLNGVKARVVDANGNPVPGATVEFTIASGTAVFQSAPTQTTDASGEAFATLKSTVAGPVSITAKVNGVPIVNGSPAIVIFTADAPSTGNPATALSVVIPTAVANGTAVTSVKAHIVDANGNPVPNATIEFTIVSGAANIVETNPMETDANGDAVITLNSTIAGDVNITATVNGNPIVNGSPATVKFIVDDPAVSNPATTLSVEVTGMVADGNSLNGVKAHVEDAQGNPVPGATIVFTIASGTAVINNSPTQTTDASGDAYLTLKSTVAGEVTITATVNGVAIVNGSPAKVIFVADVPNTGNPATALVVVKASAPANGTAVTSVKAHIVDANDNPVPNATIEFTIASGIATIVETNPIETDANGDAIITLTSTTIGEVTITATVNGVAIVNGSPAKVKFTADQPSTGNPATLLSVEIDGAPADGVALNSVKAHIEDANGHPVEDADIVFTITSGTATIVETNPLKTDANGDAIITLHSTVAGKVTITATVNGTPITNGSPAIVTFKPGNPDPGNTGTALTIVTNNAQANGTATNGVKAHIADANGNPVPNATIEFTMANGTATFVETNPLTTDANGDAIITLTSTVGGTVDITATVNGVAIVNGSPATVTFTTDPDVSAADTRLIVLSNNAIADGVETNSVKAHVVDATGSPLNMKEVFFKIESGSATVLTVQPVLTDANGDATILLASKNAGSVSVTAKVNDKPIVNGSPARLRFVPVDIYVPKVFTPNNDGNNDVVKPIVVGLTTFHFFNVYNRWGNLVFSTKDPNVGWDGRFKGVLQPVETYLWIAEGLDKDKNKITRKGMISLVR